MNLRPPRPNEVCLQVDQRLTNDIRELKANIRERSNRVRTRKALKMVGPGVVTHANLVNGLRVKQLQKAPLNANGFLSKCQNWSDTFVGGRCRQSCSRGCPYD